MWKNEFRMFCMLLAILLSLLIIAIIIVVILYYVIVYPNPCLTLLSDKSQLPINVGINVQTSEVFIIITKPIKTGLITTSNKSGGGLRVCSKPLQGFDTAVVAIVRLLRAHSVNVTLESFSCETNHPVDFSLNDGTLKLYVAGGGKKMKIKIDQLLGEIQDDSLLNYANLWLSPKHLRGASSNLTITIIDETTVTLEPPLAFAYSNFEAIRISRVNMLPSKSSKNKCGNRPVVGIRLESTFFQTVIRALWHFSTNSIPEMSPVGVSNYLQPTEVSFADFSVKARPVFFTNSSFLGVGSKQSAEVSFTKMHFKIDEKTGHLGVKSQVLLNVSNFDFETKFMESEESTHRMSRMWGGAGSVVLDTLVDVNITTGYGGEPVVYANNNGSYLKLNLNNIHIAAEGEPAFEGSLGDLSLHIQNVAAFRDFGHLSTRGQVNLNFDNADFIGSNLSPKLNFLNGSVGSFKLDTSVDISRSVSYYEKRMALKFGNYPSHPSLLKFRQAQVRTVGSGEIVGTAFNDSSFGESGDDKGFHIGADLFETELFLRVGLEEARKDVFLQLDKVNVTSPIGSTNLSSGSPFEIHILAVNKMTNRPSQFVDINLRELGDLQANATFEVDYPAPNKSRSRIEALSVKINQIKVGILQSQMQRMQHIEIPGLTMQLANGSNVSVDMKTNLEFQTSLSEIMNLVQNDGAT